MVGGLAVLRPCMAGVWGAVRGCPGERRVSGVVGRGGLDGGQVVLEDGGHSADDGWVGVGVEGMSAWGRWRPAHGRGELLRRPSSARVCLQSATGEYEWLGLPAAGDLFNVEGGQRRAWWRCTGLNVQYLY